MFIRMLLSHSELSPSQLGPFPRHFLFALSAIFLRTLWHWSKAEKARPLRPLLLCILSAVLCIDKLLVLLVVSCTPLCNMRFMFNRVLPLLSLDVLFVVLITLSLAFVVARRAEETKLWEWSTCLLARVTYFAESTHFITLYIANIVPSIRVGYGGAVIDITRINIIRI